MSASSLGLKPQEVLGFEQELAPAGERSRHEKGCRPLSRAAMVMRDCPGARTPRLYAYACFEAETSFEVSCKLDGKRLRLLRHSDG